MTTERSKLDDFSYLNFTFRQRMDKAFHTLEGILKGISLDGKIEPMEVRELTDWCEEHRQFQKRHPFREVFPAIKTALADGVLNPEELQNLLWLCSNITSESPYFDTITADLQKLQGIVHGIAADGKIEKDELTSLQNWIWENEQLCERAHRYMFVIAF